MNDRCLVADASAIVALLKREPFGPHFDPDRLVGATISAVNLSETLASLVSGTLTQEEADTAVAAVNLRIIAFDQEQARIAARLRERTRCAGLSLGDRACLALAQRLGCPAVTADRAWATVDVGVEVVLIR